MAAGLWQTGYYADWMYGREHGGQEGRNLSSKDLLLALGWLLATGTLEKLLAQRVQQLDKTLLTSLPVMFHLCFINTPTQYTGKSEIYNLCLCVLGEHSGLSWSPV